MKITWIENRAAKKAMYPSTYGDNFTQTEANKRLIKHVLAVGSASLFIFMQVSHANAQEPLPLDNWLVGSVIDKSPAKHGNLPHSPFIPFNPPQSSIAKKVNTALFIASTGVICANAYWTKSPALIIACLSITSNAMEAALRAANPAL